MEVSCSKSSKRSLQKDEFTDLLFSWSVEEILDEDLFKHQVQKIPKAFESVDGYLSSYVYPLLEETRAALASSLEAVYKAPYAEVVSLEEAKLDAQAPLEEVVFFEEAKPATCLYNVKVDNWRNRTSDRGKEPYRTLPGDFFLLSDSKPESVSHLRRIGQTYTFASVTTISDNGNDDSCTSSGFKLKTAGTVGAGHQHCKSLYVVYLTNITTHKRIWKALKMRQNLKIIEKVLVRNDLGDEDCDFCPEINYSEVETKFGSAVLSKLNDSQLGAVLACICKTRCSHRSSVELIWGPPGTGKTSTLSILLYILLEMNVRTVICAPTNTAVREMASRVATLVRNSAETDSRKNLPCSFGDMLLFGSNDRLKVGSDVDEIFLDNRVDQLTEILVSHTGWRQCVMSMLDFLENCVSHHEASVENEQSKTTPFLDYARDRFKNLVSPLRYCMLTMITHLPRRFIGEGKYRNMVQLLNLLDSLEEFLVEGSGMTSEDLKAIFMQRIMTVSESFLDTTALQRIRSHCVFVLRSLQTSLSELVFPKVTDRSLATEFCFQKASLIFCTTSTAFKLHSVDIEPFQLLVIDEAAQVKECETAIALQIKGVRLAILVGDECQLPATVSSKVSI